MGYDDLPRLLELMSGDEKHDGAAASTLDVLWVLYDRILNITPETVDDPARDRFLLSKGHGPMAFYAVLAAKGFVTEADLASFGAFDSRLGYHPDRDLIPGVEIASGSLGHGLPLSIGRVLALDYRQQSGARVFVLVGDAELDEGTNHEAIAFAGRAGLDRLTVVAIDNQSASHGWPGGIEARFAVEGWSTHVCDGRDHDDIERALTMPASRPATCRGGARGGGVVTSVPGDVVVRETMRQRFYRLVSELLDSDPRLAIVLADIGVGYLEEFGVFERHPKRAINVGIREALMVSTAGGMALEGLRPIAHSYAPFLIERSFEQVKLDFGHQGTGGILVSIGASYDWAEGGRTHHSPGDVALIGTLPDWTIHVPGHADEVEQLLRQAVADDGLVYIRLSDAVNCGARLDGCGGVALVRDGGSGAPTILAVGPMLQPVLDATDDLEATILYTATPRPLDAEGLRRLVTGTDVALVEPYLEGTSAGAVTAVLADRPIRLLSIGVPSVELRRYGTRQDHDKAYGLDAAGIRARFTSFVGSD